MKFSILFSSVASVALVNGLVTRSQAQQNRDTRSTEQRASSCNGVDNPQDPSVTLPNSLGTVHGRIAPKTPCVREFLGIPYGRSPTGNLRFAPPQPAPPFGDLDARHLPPSCMQYLMEIPRDIYTQDVLQYNLQGLNSTSKAISEDCLTLSVWTPVQPFHPHEENNGQDQQHNDKRDDEPTLLPVVVFVFGGAFTTGGQDVPYQNPTQWVQRSQAHIVVSFNYRLNIFGFPNAAGMPLQEKNPGLLDQRLAMEWIRDNIEFFGGDPKRITLWGQSAGGISVGYYQYAYPKDPIASGIIMDSGNELLSSPLFYDPDHRNFSYVAKRFGCSAEPKADAPQDAASIAERGRHELECMRGANVSGQALEDYIQTHDQALKLPYIFFAPQVDNKTVFTTEEYKKRSEEGLVADIPSVIGSNSDDGVAFVLLNPLGGVNVTDAAKVTLGIFFCTAFMATQNRLLAPNNAIPVFRYEYFGNIPSVSPKTWLGAYHASELPMIFGTYDDYRADMNNRTKEKAAEEISHAMQDAWLAFITNGAKGLEETGWPRYTGAKEGQVRMFGVNDTAVMTGSTADEDSLCPKVAETLDP